MADIVNGRCHNERAPETGPPLFSHGKLIVQAHDIGWLVSGIFTIAATVISFWLMRKHLQWYTNKAEQRYIVRILLMVPIYSVVSLASYLFWNHSTPLLLLRDCYESTVLTSFFYLLLMYISHDPEEQKEVFRKVGLSRENDRERIRAGEELKKWMFPFGGARWKPADGLYFLQLMKWGVLQYCVIRPTTTLAAVILDYSGLYCEDSWSPGWGHLYISVIVSVSVSVAMYCLLQLYMPVSAYLQPKKPLLKLFAVKAVVFLTFWQATGLSMLATFGLVKDTKYMTADNINIGIGTIMETVEMTLFALLHIKAFSYKPYQTSYPTNRLRALMHAFNFMETFRELRAGTVYLWRRMRGQEVDIMARRQAVLEGVFGRTRIEMQGNPIVAAIAKSKPADEEKAVLAVNVAVEEMVHVGEERQWLGVGDDYAYGLGYHSRRMREKSDGLEEQIEKELAKRGYSRRQPSGNRAEYDLIQPSEPTPPPERRRSRTAWWRSIYNRLSQSEPPEEAPPLVQPLPYIVEKLPPIESQRGYNPKKVQTTMRSDPRQHEYDDPPPPSVIRSYRESKSRRASAPPPLQPTELGVRANSFQPPQQRRVQMPTLSLPPSVPTSSQPTTPSSNYSDSFLARAFPNRSDASQSNEALSAVGSSQSHETSVPLAGRALVVGSEVSPSRPTIVSPMPRPVSQVASASSLHSDSFLARAFPQRSDASNSGEALPSIPPSSRSHESRVRLSGRPAALPSREVAPANPQFAHPRTGRQDVRAYEVSPSSSSKPTERSRQHRSRRTSVAVVDLDAHIPYVQPQASASASPPPVQSAVKPRLRRDQIVLPAPLAPAASRQRTTPETLPSPSSPSPTSPPTLAASSPLRRSHHSNHRRYSQSAAPHAPRDRASRRVSFPLSHPAIAEDTPTGPYDLGYVPRRHS